MDSDSSLNRNVDIEVEPPGHLGYQRYRLDEETLSKLRVPILLSSDRSHERLYVAAMDGTGNSMFDDKPENWSTVAKLHLEIRSLEDAGLTHIRSDYIEGTYTQDGLLKIPEKLVDGPFGHTFDERVETAYFKFCVQAKEWLREDPEAQIRVAGIGFSRGAEEIAALERMIHVRGIRDPDDANYRVNGENLITRIKYADRPLLVQPGLTPQVALLIDPVQTGVGEHDRRLPPSTLTTFQLTAENERRDLFKVTLHVPLGFSEDDRSLNLARPGSHGNMADTHLRNGLGIENYNLSVEFLNRLSDKPYLEKRPLPTDPEQYVIHRSDQHMGGLYSTRGYDRDGIRDHVDALAPERLCRRAVVDDCNRKEPIDEALDARFERRTAPPPAQHPLPAPATEREAGEPWPGLNDLVAKASRAGTSDPASVMPAVVEDYLRGPWGKQFQAALANELAARNPAVPVPIEPARVEPPAQGR